MKGILLISLIVVLSSIVVAQYEYAFMPSIPEEDEELDPATVEEAGCPRIEKLKNVNLKALLGHWHLPYMSKHYIRFLAKSMHGKFMKRSSMGRTCIKMNVRELPSGGTPTNKNATIWLQSKCPRTGSEWNLACAPTADNPINSKWYCNDLNGSSTDGDSFIYVVDTDGKSWSLIVRCFPNNGMNWAIFSKEKELPVPLVKSLLREVELLGFKLSNVVEIPYTKCMTIAE